jgi:hypothetical protein
MTQIFAEEEMEVVLVWCLTQIVFYEKAGCHCWLVQQCPPFFETHCWASQQWHPNAAFSTGDNPPHSGCFGLR